MSTKEREVISKDNFNEEDKDQRSWIDVFFEPGLPKSDGLQPTSEV